MLFNITLFISCFAIGFFGIPPISAWYTEWADAYKPLGGWQK